MFFVITVLGLVASTPHDAAEATEPRQPVPDSAVLPASQQPRIGERLSFHGYWLGIPVGYGWIEVKGPTTLNGRAVIHIEAHGRTNEVLSKFYPIHDVVHSYLDAQTFQPLQFEKHQREGHYHSDEIVRFDHERSVASYRSLVNGSTKDIPLPAVFQDLMSALYWFRAQPLHPGQPMTVDLYTDEKIYHTELQIGELTTLELLKRGTFPCFVVEPKAFFKGFLVRRGRLWAYLSADDQRLPLLVKATTPWGPMSAVLDEASFPANMPRRHPGRHPLQ